MKRILSVLLLIITICISTIANADFSDMTGSETYYDAVNRLNALNIMNGISENEFGTESFVTREEFSEIIVKASGQQDTAAAMKGTSPYGDVEPNSATSGYINFVVSKGYITSMVDGNFHPYENVTYAQVCTAVVRMLGYADSDLKGLWPKKYIEKAANLKLTENISFASDEYVPRRAIAQIIDKLLDTKVKKASAADEDKTFADYSELYTECIILGNSVSSSKLADNQVLTDKGIFYYDPGKLELVLGYIYRLDISDENIEAAYGMQRTYEGISVESTVGNKVSYKDKKGEIAYKTLPDKPTYYYNGEKIEYDAIKDKLQTRSSIVFAYNKQKTGYEYAVIFDPIYSDPVVAREFDPSSRQLGAITLDTDILVVRDGEKADITDIRDKDVVYKVSDVWNLNSYILDVVDRAGGKVNDVFPDRVTPKYVQVDDVDYYFSEDIDIQKLTVKPGILEEDDNIVMLLGRDGKVVDLEYPGNDDNSSYAVVLNTFMETTGTTSGKVEFTYSAKVLTSDGFTATYYCDNDPSQLKGSLVKLTWKNSNKVHMEYISNNYQKEISINRTERYVNQDYVADNVKVFNLISNEDGVDAEAKLIDFEDLPQGAITDNKVMNILKSGKFDDISVIFTRDILGEAYSTGIIKKSGMVNNGKSYSYSYTLLINGKEYTYDEQIANGEVGKVVDVQLAGGKVVSVGNVKEPDYKWNTVETYDSKRIKLNDKIFWLSKNITVYFIDYDGDIEVKTLGDIDVEDMYGNVTLYSNKDSYSGKVDVIVVKQ